MKSTTIDTTHKLWLPAMRVLAAETLTQLSWRWHGIGVIQAYLHPLDTERELEFRLHIWSPRLVLAGMHESGDTHDHRFDLYSTVLCGQLLHTEFELTPDPDGDYDLWDFVSARHHDGSNNASMRQLHQRQRVKRTAMNISSGASYFFPKRKFHSSRPLSDIVVTLVEKLNQEKDKARVLAPLSKTPVPAFGYSTDDLAKMNMGELVVEAKERLLQEAAL